MKIETVGFLWDMHAFHACCYGWRVQTDVNGPLISTHFYTINYQTVEAAWGNQYTREL